MRAAIGLGSNLPSRFGEPSDNLHEAVRRLGRVSTVRHLSSFRSTQPVGYLQQPHFTNAAALLETDLSPFDLLAALLQIEREMGRVRPTDLPPKGPRIIDLDLLLYESEGTSLVLHTPELVLPHPEMHRRAFVLQPLAEIAPELIHPTLGQSLRSLWQALENVPADPRSAA